MIIITKYNLWWTLHRIFEHFVHIKSIIDTYMTFRNLIQEVKCVLSPLNAFNMGFSGS